MRYYPVVLSALLLFILSALSCQQALAVADPFEPVHVALGPDGNVYAIISGNDSTVDHIFVFAQDGRLLRTINGGADLIAFDAAGNLYAYDIQGPSIRRMDIDGKVTGIWNYQPKTDIVIGGMGVSPDGKLYISECFYPPPYNTSAPPAFYGTRIVILSENGSEQIVFSDNETNSPQGIGIMAIDANGTIYAISTSNSFKIIAPDGNITTVGHAGGDDGAFNTITGISLGRDGYLYVTEYGNHRVQKLTTNGTFVQKWKGAGFDAFLYPWGASADANGMVFIPDPHNERIVWVTPGYTFGDNTAENLKGQGTTWGNVYQGTNYTTRLHEIAAESQATATPGFSSFLAFSGLFLGIVLCLWRGMKC